MTNRRVLNKIFWDKREDPRNYEVTFVHRGAVKDRKTIPCEKIIRLESSGFIYEGEEGETFIPYHRIREIKNIKDDGVVWLSRRR